MPDINSDIQYLKGVGPAYAKKFAKLGIYTIRDLLLHYPRRYIDYSQPYTVVSAPFDVDCCVKATVLQRDPDRRIKAGGCSPMCWQGTIRECWRFPGSTRPIRRKSWNLEPNIISRAALAA